MSSNSLMMQTFEAFAEAATAAVTAAEPVYFNRKACGWAKRSFTLLGMKRDDRRARLVLTVEFGQSGFADSDADALLLPRPSGNIDYTVTMKLDFKAAARGWAFDGGRYTSRGQRFQITPAKVSAEPDALPYIVITLMMKSQASAAAVA